MKMPAKKKKEQRRKQAAKRKQQKKDETKSDEQTTYDIETDAAVDTTEETKDIWDTGDGAQLNETAIRAEGLQCDSSGATDLPASQQKLKNYLQDPKYKNWQKAGLFFYTVRDVLVPCVEDVSKAIHRELMSLSQSCKCLNKELCTSCEKKWKAKIQGFVVEGYVIDWKNKYIVQQPNKHWSVAKCFVEYNQQDKDSASDCDISPLLAFIVNCNRFKETDFGHIQDSARKVRKDRNNYIHRGKSEISSKELQDYKRNMVTLLKNTKLKATGKADEAAMFIEKVCDVEYIILLEDEVKAELSCLQGQVDRICSRLHSDINPQIKSLDGQVSDFGRKLKELDEKKADQSEYKKLLQEIVEKGAFLKELEQRVTTLEGRVDKLEDQQSSHHRMSQEVSSDMSETPKNRRPETDGLKQLKYQTEDKLNTLRCLKCIPTKQAEEAKTLLEGKRSIVIRGNPGEGKTTTALYLIDNEMYRDKRVVLYSPQDWKTVDTEWVDIVVLEDIFGQFDLDSGRLQEWMVYLPTIQEHVVAEKLQVIITTRDDILTMAYSKLGSLKLFSHDLSLTLSSKQLIDSEKISILNRELQRHKKNMREDEKEKCLANFSGLLGFPQCCLLFAGDSTLFDKGPDFFSSPSKFFFENIAKLESKRFLSLAFLFCNGKILEENLSPETMPKTSKDLLSKLASNLSISKRNASITLLRDAYDIFLDVYVVKSMSYGFSFWSDKPCIQFTHATVSEAVGQVLGNRCPEMVVKYCHSEYLYQRTYTAKAKDVNSQNVFIPVSVYRLLAERMVCDVVKEGSLVKGVVKHSSLKQHDFLKKLKFELQKGNEIKNFFTARYNSCNIDSRHPIRSFISGKDSSNSSGEYLSKGKCYTFLQYILQNDDEVVRLVYSEFMDFLKCAHNKNSMDCWKCQHKQTLLELSLYYHHFHTADELITMNACYTHISLCNAAKHGDLIRVQTILKALKRSQVFDPGCKEAKYVLCRACLSGKNDLIELLLQEGIMADIRQVIDAMQSGDIGVLKKVVEHLKSHNKWNPHWETYSTPKNFRDLCQQYLHWKLYSTHENFNDLFQQLQTPVTYFKRRTENSIPYSTALFLSFCNEKFDMADYLLKNEVDTLMCMLPALSKHSSQNAVARVIQDLKETKKWDPKCNSASKALKIAYGQKKYDVCDILVQEGVSLTMKNLPCLIYTYEHIKRAVQNLKDTNNWDPKCHYACKALKYAYLEHKFDVCDLLVQNNVSLTMKNLYKIADKASFESIKKAIQNLKDTGNWDPKSHYASGALANAFAKDLYDVYNLLMQEGVSLTMENLYDMVGKASFESVKKAIQNLKDTKNWDPKSSFASLALANAFAKDLYDVYNLLMQEGVSLTMENLYDMVGKASFESVKKAIQNLKDTKNWDPKSSFASLALANAFAKDLYDVYNLLMQEGLSLTMINLFHLFNFVSLELIKKAIQNMKDAGNWDPEFETLQYACIHENYDLCDLLVQEGVSLTMNNLCYLVYNPSFASIKNAVQNLKTSGKWNPKCKDASESLKNAFIAEKYDVCDLLVQASVSLSMNDLPSVVSRGSVESTKRAIQHLKDTGNWDRDGDDAFNALENAFNEMKYDVCDLLVQEGISLTMNTLPNFVSFSSFEYIDIAIKNMKDAGNWDSECDVALEALKVAYTYEKYDVCDLLVQEGVSLTMKNLCDLVYNPSFASIKNAVQNLIDSGNWDPKCKDASESLENAFIAEKYDVCDLLVQASVSLSMKHLPSVVSRGSVESTKRAIQNLKDTGNWDHDRDDAFNALENAFKKMKYDVCDLLVQEGISLTMKNLYGLVKKASYESIKKAIQNLKDSRHWDPKCDDASKALNKAFIEEKYDICDLLFQESISLSMKHLPSVVSSGSFEYIKRAIETLKDTGNWNCNGDDAFKALKHSLSKEMYDVCDLLIQEGISLTMNDLPSVVSSGSFKFIKKAMKNLNDTGNWDCDGDDAFKALEIAFSKKRYDVCDLLVQEGISLTMKNLSIVVFNGSFKYVKRTIQHLKKTYSWDPKCDDALSNASCQMKDDVCYLLVQEGISLTMKNLPHIVNSGRFEHIEKVIQHLKDTKMWDHECDDASKALENAYKHRKYDVCNLLIEEKVSLTMKNLSNVVSSGSYKYTKQIIQYLKETDSWNPKCDYAYIALSNAYCQMKDDVCYLLVQEGISLTMKILPHIVSSGRFEHIEKVIQHLKDTKMWDHKCDDASEALENAYEHRKYDVCDLLIQEGVSFTMNNHPLPVYNVNSESIKMAVQKMISIDH